MKLSQDENNRKIQVNKQIQSMIESGSYSREEILDFVQTKCQDVNLTPQTLGQIFELYANVKYDENDELSGFSSEIPVDELKQIHHSFESTNGNQWARSDESYLGKRYIISRPKLKGKVTAIRLDGLNINSIKKHRSINPNIRKLLEKENCRVLDTHSQIEIDHKSGRYNVLSNLNPNNQKLEDFQPLSKAANDAKRQHCAECQKTGKRYDAKRLGYKESFIAGDENTPTCAGCYWYDPKKFNEIISKDFKKL